MTGEELLWQKDGLAYLDKGVDNPLGGHIRDVNFAFLAFDQMSR